MASVTLPPPPKRSSSPKVAAAQAALDAAKAQDKADRHAAAADDAHKAAAKAAKKAGVAAPVAGTGGRAASAAGTASAFKGLKKVSTQQWAAGQRVAERAGEGMAKFVPTALGKGALKLGLKGLPIVGSLAGAYFAYEDFEKGDYLGAALSVVGAIPGPVGWVGLGLRFAWGIFHNGNAGSGYGMWDAPDGTSTFMLPGSAKDVAGVSDVDATLSQAQRSVFAFTDGPAGSVWNESPPAALRIDTDEVKAAVTSYLNAVAAHFDKIDKALQSSGEPYMAQYRTKLAPHFAAMAKLPHRASEITAALTAVSDSAGHKYTAVLDANRAARTQLSGNGKMPDSGPATTLSTRLQQEGSTMTAANQKLAAVFGETPVPVLVSRSADAPVQHRRTDRVTTGDPQPYVTTGTGTPTPTPTTGTPTPTQTPNLGTGGGTPMSTPSMGSGGGGTPMSTPSMGSSGGGTPLTSPQSEKRSGSGHKLVDDDDKAKSETKPKRRLSTADQVDNSRAGGVAPAAAAGPGTGAAPAGKAQAPGAGTAKPAAADGPKEVDVKGTKVNAPDAKTAKMLQLLGGADPAHPMSLADAAAKAGLVAPVPGHDPGQQISPTEARAGDVLVAGDKHLLLLGDGKFYDLDTYQVVGTDALPKDMGDRAGYFRLADAAATGNASGPTPDPAAFSVPGATGAPAGPTDTGQVPPGGGAPAPGGVSGTGTPDPLGGSGGMPPGGMPGVPSAPGVSKGSPGLPSAGGRAHSDPVPAPASPNLDPSAVK